ncbi:MAG: oligosaccharide flippase family protein [DPANN group archaeon]|nr:oligosaccharide flippase family protein [DPANN group archaeon]
MINKLLNTIKNDTLVKQNIILFAGTMTLNVLNYFYHFAVGRILGPADYGILAVFFSIIYILFAPVNTIQTILTKFTADFIAKNETGKVAYLLKRSLQILGYISLLIFGIFFLFSPQIAKFLLIDNINYVRLFSIAFLVIFVTAVTRGFLQGYQNFKILSASLILEGAAKFSIALLLIYFGFNLYGAIVAISLALLFSFLFTFYYLQKLIPKDAIKVDSSAIYAYSLPVLITMMVITAMYTFDVILVKHFFEPVTAGLYAAASLLGKIIFFASYSFSWVMFPKIAEAYSKGEEYKHIFRKSLLLVSILVAIAVFVYWLIPDLVVGLLFGVEYLAVTDLIAPFGLAMGLFSIAFIVTNYYLSTNRTKFIYVLAAFAILEIAAIWFFHQTLEQVVNILLATMLALVISLFIVRK